MHRCSWKKFQDKIWNWIWSRKRNCLFEKM